MPYTKEVGRRFWFEFDRTTKYNQAFMQIVARGGAGNVQSVFADSRASGQYPAQFLRFVSPHSQDWQMMAKTQVDSIEAYLSSDWTYIQAAFEDFGQGTLLDTDPQRQANNDSIHIMDIQGSEPPVGYHRWHASIRAIQLLKIGDSSWWEQLDQFLGLAWAIQSFARPKQQSTVNPPISDTNLKALRDSWLSLSPERRDRQYDLTGDVGYHPDPKNPTD